MQKKQDCPPRAIIISEQFLRKKPIASTFQKWGYLNEKGNDMWDVHVIVF